MTSPEALARRRRMRMHLRRLNRQPTRPHPLLKQKSVSTAGTPVRPATAWLCGADSTTND
jgi:hypothetical protein